MMGTNLAWILLYFTVGWLFTRLFDIDDFTWGLSIFFGWPIIAAGVLVLFVLLILFGVAFAVDETIHRLFRKGA